MMKHIQFVLFTCVIFCIACQSNSTSSTASSKSENQLASEIISEKLSPEAFLTKLTESGREQLVDVRTPAEVENGYIQGAVNFNIQSDDFRENLSQLDPNKPIFVYCAKGGRSGRAAKALEELGFKEIYDLAGGYTDWLEKNLEGDK